MILAMTAATANRTLYKDQFKTKRYVGHSAICLAFYFLFQLDFIVNGFVAVGTYEKTR